MSLGNWSLNRKLTSVGMLLALLLLSSVGIAASNNINNLIQNQYWVDHTYKVLAAIGEATTALNEATLNRRGFVISQDSSYITSYKTSVQQVWTTIQQLQKLTADNPLQQQRIQLLKPVVTRRLNELEQSIAQVKQKSPNPDFQAALTTRGKETQRLIQGYLAEMRQTEENLLVQRLEVTQTSARNTQTLVMAGSLIGFTLLLGVFFLLRKEIARRGRAENSMKDLNTTLENRVEERTKLLSQSNALLQTEIIDRIKAEEELQTAKAELEQRVEERTAIITEINRQLQESEIKFRNAFDSAPIGVALLGLDGQWLRVNPPLCEITGYSKKELLTRNFQDLIVQDEQERDQFQHQQLLNGEIRSYETRKQWIHKDGHVVWVLLNLSLIRSSDGEPQCLISHIQDITKQQAIEQMKNEFISVVSHELRTPLTSIRGSLGLLATGIYNNKPEKAHRMIEIAQIDTERLYRLVNDILDLERLESGRITLVKESCKVEFLLRQSAQAMQASANAANITLSIAAIEAEVWAAPDSIIQTLTNLLSNAIKFSPPQSTIWLKAELCDRASSSSPAPPSPPTSSPLPPILFSVQDQGRGIPPDKLESIFGRFQQVDASDSRQKGGTGLGLAICRSIIQQHGGQIWVESDLEKGSTFHFTLPQANPSES